MILRCHPDASEAACLIDIFIFTLLRNFGRGNALK